MSHSLRVEDLWKEYRIGGAPRGHDTFYEALSSFLRSPFGAVRRRAAIRTTGEGRFWALREINLEVAPGEVLGVIGKNGAGKSTLLKVLSRITDPTRGRIEIRGRLASLLEVGTGFHPELTGRENIFLNGTILGMTRREIARKFDEIVAFAEVEKFLDTPVKRYSSGMYVRLAFAVAAHLEPDVLLVDEVLAVGDASFQKKCLEKMSQVREEGRTIVFVSHNMSSVSALCQRAILLDGGKVSACGTVSDVIDEYVQEVIPESTGEVDLADNPLRNKSAVKIFRRARLRDCAGRVTRSVRSGESLSIELELEVPRAVEEPRIEIGINDPLGRRLFSVGNFLSERSSPVIRGRCTVSCEIEELPLAPGRYAMTFCFGHYHGAVFDLLESALPIEVSPGPFYGKDIPLRPDLGPVLVRSRWTYSEQAVEAR